MIKNILTALTVSAAVLAAGAQQTGKVTRTYFPDPQDVEFGTPAFDKKRGFTTYAETMTYLNKLATEYPQLLSLQIVGRTQKNREIPMVRVSRRGGDADKLRVMYTGGIHGNEPGGSEGLLYFIKQLCQDSTLTGLLDKIDFYILPVVNIDGSEEHKRLTANGLDLNRDMTLLNTPEAKTLQRVATTVNPDLFIDFHEYKPLRASYEDIADGELITNPNDFMFLFSSNPNVAPSLRSIVSDLYVANASAMADRNGLTHHTYFTTKSDKGDVVFNVGGVSPRSSSNNMALRGAISMLMEIRGIGLGRTSYKRRVNTVYKLAESYARTTFDNADAVRKAVDDGRHNDADIAVSFKSKAVSDYPLEFIDIIKCSKVTIPVEARIAPETEVVMTRKRPAAYYLAPSEVRAASILRDFGVRVDELPAPETVKAETYKVTRTVESHDLVAGILPLAVVTELSAGDVTMPAGSFRIDLDQPLATLVTVLLEPESANGFVNYRVIGAEAGKKLNIYRKIK